MNSPVCVLARRERAVKEMTLRRGPIFSCGVWGGLIRLPLNLPLPANNANWITYHAPLMVCGFLGTVIALERAVGLRHGWTYLAPVLTGAGALTLAAGMSGRLGPLLLTLGSACFVAVSWRVVLLQRTLFTVTLSVAAPKAFGAPRTPICTESEYDVPSAITHS